MKKEEYKGPKCICKQCPSYIKSSEEIAYCFRGKSKAIKEEKGCLCPACPVQEKFKFKHVYYCTKGSEKQLTKK